MSDKHVDEGAGRVKEAAGSITGDEKLKREGRTDQARASMKDAADDAAEKAKQAADILTGGDDH